MTRPLIPVDKEDFEALKARVAALEALNMPLPPKTTILEPSR